MPLRVAIESPALGILDAVVEANECERLAIEQLPMARERKQPNRMIRRQRVEPRARKTRIGPCRLAEFTEDQPSSRR